MTPQEKKEEIVFQDNFPDFVICGGDGLTTSSQN
jgi:hypothetical protein